MLSKLVQLVCLIEMKEFYNMRCTVTFTLKSCIQN